MFNTSTKELFGTHDITTGMYVLLIIILIIQYVLIFQPADILSESNNKIYYRHVNKCVVDYDTNIVDLDKLRGSNYWLSYETDKCNVTRWEIIHFIFHTFLGYFYNIYVSQGISLGFELFEEYYYSCGSILDLFYNMAGFLFGHYLKYGYK